MRVLKKPPVLIGGAKQNHLKMFYNQMKVILFSFVVAIPKGCNSFIFIRPNQF